MNQVRTFCCFVALTLAPVVLLAQNTVADIALELIDRPKATSPDGLTGTFSFRLTNLGPETAGLFALPPTQVYVGSTMVDILPEGQEMSVRSTDTASCLVHESISSDPPPGEPPKVGYLLLPGPQPPGAVIFCPLEYEILPGLDHELRIRWVAGAFRTDDPDPTNNEFTLIFNRQASQIPSLTPTGMAAFALALLAAFVVVRRRAA